MKRILVTGGAGFLGAYMCERLLAAGNEVTCLDNYRTGARMNIVELMKQPRFHVMKQSFSTRSRASSTRSTILPARHRRRTTSSIPYSPSRPAFSAR